MKKKAAKKLKPIRRSHVSTWRFGILNHIGTIWTPETFETEDEAARYLARRQNQHSDLRRHKVVPVRVTVTPIKLRGGRK